jgi:hypothetical protein
MKYTCFLIFCSKVICFRSPGRAKLGICCVSAKYAALRGKNKDWLTRNQNNVSEWSDMSTRGLLFH